MGRGCREVGLCSGGCGGGGRHKVLILWEEICVGKTGSQTVRRARWDGTKRNSGDDYSGVAEWHTDEDEGRRGITLPPRTDAKHTTRTLHWSMPEWSSIRASTLSLGLMDAEWWLPASPTNITAAAFIAQRLFFYLFLNPFLVNTCRLLRNVWNKR